MVQHHQKYNSFFTDFYNMQPMPIFSILDRVDSTNNYAMGMVHAGMAKHGMTWFARFQTAGKGQRSKQWQSEPDRNIMMSIVLKTDDYRIEKTYAFNATIAVACCTFLMKMTGEDFKIKWPNDLMWRDRKAGGILIENIIRGKEWLWSIAGIGININQTDFENLEQAISIKEITQVNYDVIDMAKQLQKWLIDATLTPDPEIMNLYNNMLFKRGEEVKFKKNAVVFSGMVDYVDEFGQLHLSNHPESISFGELQWLLR